MKDFNINVFLKNLVLTSIIGFAFSLNNADAQRFKASAVLGLNFAQIEGDELAGYSKLGVTGGIKLAYPLKENVDVNLEMLYSQRGSTEGFSFGGSGNFVDLQYIELPVYVNIKDWFIEEGRYHKVKAHAGLTYAYLFNVNSTNGLLSNDIDSYQRNDIGWLLGLDYAFNSKIGMSIRYTKSFNSLYVVRAIGYFITARTEYFF